MFFSDDTIDRVRSASDIIDVVSDYVRLKRSGTNYFGLCPFHSEKTPSFSVNPEMGIFKCFGCSAGGDVFQFVMRVESLSFPESVRLLAKRAGVELPEEGAEDLERVGETEAIYGALRYAARFYYHHLTQTDGGKPVLGYLRDRRFSSGTIKKFGLGYAPDSWDALLRSAEQHHVSRDVLEQAGLIIPRKNGTGHYDRFRHRVMFPILSHVGKVLGFGGRVLDGGSRQPKYINSPETRVYNKSRVLYGLYQAKHAVRKKEEAIIVEGYTDVIALHQAGIQNVVASSGTALTKEQVRLISRYARKIVLVFDADAAGTGAAMRAIDLVLPEGLSVYIVTLPPDEDPDSFARRGDASVEAYLVEQRHDFASYLYELARKEGRLETPEGEADTMHSILNAIARMPDPLMRETYLRRSSEILNVPDVRLHEVLDGLIRSERAKERRHKASAPPRGPRRPFSSDIGPDRTHAPATRQGPLPEEKTLIRLMLEHGSSMVEFILGNTSLEEFSAGASRITAERFLMQYEQGNVNRSAFLDGSYGEDVQRLAAEVAVIRHEPSENWERKQRITVPRLDEDPYEAAMSAMTLLKLDRVNEAIDAQREAIFRAARSGDDVQPMQSKMMALHELRKRIERREFLEEE